MTLNNKALAELEDVKGVHNVVFEVNFDEENKECVKITIAGNESIIKYTDLFAVMFTLANKEQQAKMIPVREELGYQYMKTITIKTTKDLKEGEFITVNVPINVPKVIEESILAEQKLAQSTE